MNDALKTYQKYSKAVSRTEQQTEINQQQKAELIRKQKEIETLSNEVVAGQREEQTLLQQQQLIIYGLLAIIAIILVTSYFIFKNAQASKRANQLLALKSLRGQMNPHFIFNALNSVTGMEVPSSVNTRVIPHLIPTKPTVIFIASNNEP